MISRLASRAGPTSLCSIRLVRGHAVSKISIDPDLQAKLTNLAAEVELCDSAGRTLGYFVPTERYLKLMAAWLNAQITDEELERRDKEPGGRTLAEIWQRLRQE